MNWTSEHHTQNKLISGKPHYLDVIHTAEAIQLVEKLQHSSLHLPISCLLAVEPLGADGVQLVDEDDVPKYVLLPKISSCSFIAHAILLLFPLPLQH